MSQFSAIVRYECLMAWRRRSLAVLWVLLLAGIVGFALLVESINRDAPVMREAVAENVTADLPAWAQGIDLGVAQNTFSVMSLMISVLVIFSVGVTLMVGETIPLDRQFKVRELLDALPLSRAVYLGGKVVSVWLGLFGGMVGLSTLGALLLHFIFGAYDLRVYALLWLVMLLPASLTAAAVGVLGASPVGSRRAAVMVGLALLPVVLIVVFVAMPSLTVSAALIEPIYALGLFLEPGRVSSAEIIRGIGSAYASLAGVLLAIWLAAWALMRIRQAG